jgi:hypothetical protein
VGEYDAASVVGRMAGLPDSEPDPRTALPATAARMVELFATTERESAHEGVRRHTGFLGYPFADDGYDVMGKLPAAWRVVPALGDWPYYVVWAHPRDRALMVYIEGDLTIEVADTDAAWAALKRRAATDHDRGA